MPHTPQIKTPATHMRGGTLKAMLINAGIPTIFINAKVIGYTGAELQCAIVDGRLGASAGGCVLKDTDTGYG